MEIPESLKRLLEHIHIIELHGPECGDHDDEADESWTQIAKLGQDDTLKRKIYLSDMAKCRSEIEVLMAKLDAVKAKAISEKTSFWAYIREKYCLPAKANIRIAEDGRIVMRQEKGDSDGK